MAAKKTEAEIRAEIQRLKDFLSKGRHPQYRHTAIIIRITQLEWVLGEGEFPE